MATLLMVAVITGAAVAFFQSTRIERFVTRNYADLARARLAAEGGTVAGQALITALFTNYPDSAVAWALLPDLNASQTNGLATFWFRTTDNTGFLTNGQNAATPASRPVFIFAHPLASGAGAVATNNFNATAAFPATNTPGSQPGLNAQNSIDLNADNWIGTPPGGSKPVLRAKWIEVLQDPAQPKNTNLNSAGFPINPAVARYAFWAEDESFRVNVNLAGITPRSNNTPGTSVTNLVLQGALAGNDTNFASGIFSLQRSLSNRIPSPGTIALASAYPANGYENNKFAVTTHSSALNLSRGGALRLNLNQVVSTTTSDTVIRQQLDRILAAITNQSALTNTNITQRTAAMPDFGQRFYRLNNFQSRLSDLEVVGALGTNAHTNVYLRRIAANLRDYIDTDSIPTIVQTNGTIRTNLLAVNENDGPSDVQAVGKEAVPLLTEFGIRFQKVNWAARPGGGFNFEFNVFFYFEFWNLTSKTISLADLNQPSLRIYNMFLFDVGPGGAMQEVSVGGTPMADPRLDFIRPLNQAIGLDNLGFRPNSFTTITTDPNPISISGSSPFSIPNAGVKYRGFTLTNRVRAQLGQSAGRAGGERWDCDLRMMLLSGNTLWENFSALNTFDIRPGGTNPVTINNDFTELTMISSLRGNFQTGFSGRSGDPRSKVDQMAVLKYLTNASDFDQTRFYNSESHSFGRLNGSSAYNFPNNWPDWSPDSVGPEYAPYRHLDSNLDSIGRLGDVYDPAFVPETGVSSTVLARKRGGGRTFKVGQAELWNGTLNPYGLWDGSETNRSRNWTAWRLADVFTVTNATTLPGLININGALRDPSALAATVWDLRYEPLRQPGQSNNVIVPDGAIQTANRALLTANFTNAVRNHLSGGVVDANPGNDRIFWERGQISELVTVANLPLFSSTDSSLTGIQFSRVQDRGREELVRRMLDLITTKGNTYTVYAIGQSLNPRTGQPIATQRMKRTFRIDPVFNPALPADNAFDPTASGTGLGSDRFRRPSSFTVSTLQTSLE